MATMVRPTWSPETDEHRRLVEETVAAVKAWRAAETAMWAKFVEAKAAGAKVSYLLNAIEEDDPTRDDPSRATVFRRLKELGATAGD